MSQQTRKIIHTVYGLVLTVLLLATAVSFAVSCVQIYRLGESPFTYETIGEKFDRLAIPAYLTVLFVVGGGFLSLLPVDREKTRPVHDPLTVLRHLRARLDTDTCDGETLALLSREARRRRVIMTAAACATAVLFLPAFIWCLDLDHFTVENLNGDIITAACFILPAAVLAFAGWVAALILRYASVRRETDALRAALRLQGRAAPAEKPTRRDLWADPRLLWPLRGVMLALGVLFIILGVRNGGMADVLGKAIRICTECIGLG